MMKAHTARRALLLSAMALLLCVSMLIGTTFAWFTDSVTSGVNIIAAGNLDVSLEYAKIENGSITDWDTVENAQKLFDPDALWEPGRVEVVYLKVSNLGTLQLKYQLGVNVTKEIPGTNMENVEFKLSDHLVFKAVEMPDSMTTYTDRQAVAVAAGTELGLKDYNGKTTQLEVGGTDYVALIVYMPETVGNEANYRGSSIPTIELGVSLLATQVVAENDSFGPDYDEGAWMEQMQVFTAQDLQNAINNGQNNIALMDNIKTAEGILIPSDATVLLDLNGKSISMEDDKLTSAYAIRNTGTLVLRDSVGGGSVNARGIYNGYDMNNTPVPSAKMIIEGGTYNAMGTDGGAAVFNYGQLTITGASFASNGGYGLNNRETGTMQISNADVKGGVYNLGDLTLNNTTVLQHISGRHAVYNWEGSVTVNGGVFDSLSGNELILADGQDATVVINGGTFNKTAKSWLLGAATGKNITFTITGGTFNGYVNKPENTVDTIRPYNDPILVSGGTFNFDPSPWLADGYTAVKNANGTWTVRSKSAYENDGYVVKQPANVGDAAAALDFSKDVAVSLPAGQVSDSAIALNYTGSSDNNFALVGENTVFAGDLQISSHPNFELGSNATLVIDGITVNGTLKVVAYYKNIVIRNVKAKAIEVHDGGNVIVENCTIDGASGNGLYVVATAEGYDLTLLGNTIRNCGKNAVQISGCAMGPTYGAGDVTVTGNTFENWCTVNDKPRAGFKVWGDSTLAPSSISSESELTSAALALVDAIRNGNNTFISSNSNQPQFDFYDCIF